MKKFVCLLLSLCLCAGCVIPAYADETEYAPFVVSGVDGEGAPFRLTFSAARARKVTVTTTLEFDAEEEGAEVNQRSVTVLTLCPGSMITVGAGREGVPALRGTGSVADGFLMDQHEAEILSTGSVDTLFRFLWYDGGLFLNTAGYLGDATGETYLLELGKDSPGGYRAYSFEKEEEFTYTFTAAKVETRSVTLRFSMPERLLSGNEGTYYDEYETVRATVIKVRPGSISRVVQDDDEWPNIYLNPGEIDEQGRYTIASVRSTGRQYWIRTDFLNGPVDDYLSIGSCYCYTDYVATGNLTEMCLIQLDDACPFEDVRVSDYYAQSVLWAVNRGVTLGTSERTFSPALTCTRAQILTFIWRYQGQPEPGVSNPFRDVSPENYYYNAALWAYEQGMVDGGAFGGDEPCTRADAVTYLWILAGKPRSDYYPDRFRDVPSGASYAQAVSFAVDAFITNGTSSDTFSPERVCTRGNIVTFLLRYNQRLHEYTQG